MRRWWVGLVLLTVSLPVRADKPTGRLVADQWDAAYLNDGKAGFVHTTVREIETGDEKIFRTVSELDLKVKRFQDTARLFMQTGTDETADGKVTGVFMRQELAQDQQRVLRGAVEGDQLHVKVTGHAVPMDKKIWWNEKVIGLYGELNI